MSSGHAFHCSQCSFQFSSGWSHHQGGISLVCSHCGERFFAMGEHSIWGPAPNERLPIYHERRVSKRKGTVTERTGLFLTAFESSSQQGLLRVEPPSLLCPCCQADGTVSGTLSAGEACPSAVLEQSSTMASLNTNQALSPANAAELNRPADARQSDSALKEAAERKLRSCGLSEDKIPGRVVTAGGVRLKVEK